MLGTMMLPTVSREMEEFEGESERATGDCRSESHGGVASPTSSNSGDSTGPSSPQAQDIARKNPFPLPMRGLENPLDFDVGPHEIHSMIAARPTVPRLYSSYSSKRKEGMKGEVTGTRGPRLSRLLTPDQLEELEKAYQEDPYPDYFQLGIKVGLKSHQVRHWFQTRRKSNRGKRCRTDSDDVTLEDAETENIAMKFSEDAIDSFEQEVKDLSRKRKRLLPPSFNGHTPPGTPGFDDYPPRTGLATLDGDPVNRAGLPRSMTPVTLAPHAHSNGMNTHPISTASSIYRMLSTQQPNHRPGSIPPNVNVALHPAFGMQWQLPTPAVESLIEKGDVEVLMEQRDFLKGMLEQQEALRYMWDQQITSLKKLLNVCEMKISKEKVRETPKNAKQPIQKAHTKEIQSSTTIPQPTSAIVSPITSTGIHSELVRSLLNTTQPFTAFNLGLDMPKTSTALYHNNNNNNQSKIVTPMYGGVAIDMRSDMASTNSLTPNSSRRQSRDDVDSRIDADMSGENENEVHGQRSPLNMTAGTDDKPGMRQLSDEDEYGPVYTPPSDDTPSVGNLPSDTDTPLSSVGGEKFSPDDLFPSLPSRDGDSKPELSLSLDDTFDMYTRVSTDSKSRVFSCTLCDKSFSSRSNLRAHFRTHTGEKPFFCNFCGRKFAQRSTLRTHKRIHTGDMPYKCSHCNRAFRDYSTLSKHARTHTGDRPYACQICGRAFAQSGNLQRHIKHTHPNAYVQPGSTPIRVSVNNLPTKTEAPFGRRRKGADLLSVYAKVPSMKTGYSTPKAGGRPSENDPPSMVAAFPIRVSSDSNEALDFSTKV